MSVQNLNKSQRNLNEVASAAVETWQLGRMLHGGFLGLTVLILCIQMCIIIYGTVRSSIENKRDLPPSLYSPWWRLKQVGIKDARAPFWSTSGSAWLLVMERRRSMTWKGGALTQKVLRQAHALHSWWHLWWSLVSVTENHEASVSNCELKTDVCLVTQQMTCGKSLTFRVWEYSNFSSTKWPPALTGKPHWIYKQAGEKRYLSGMFGEVQKKKRQAFIYA